MGQTGKLFELLAVADSSNLVVGKVECLKFEAVLEACYLSDPVVGQIEDY